MLFCIAASAVRALSQVTAGPLPSSIFRRVLLNTRYRQLEIRGAWTGEDRCVAYFRLGLSIGL